jgi:hypothetical protein
MSKLIVNCETGETVERDLNKAEKDQLKVDKEFSATELAELQAREAAKETAKAAILDRLGLTADELKTILG